MSPAVDPDVQRGSNIASMRPSFLGTNTRYHHAVMDTEKSLMRKGLPYRMVSSHLSCEQRVQVELLPWEKHRADNVLRL